jgi:hypothetical protein
MAIITLERFKALAGITGNGQDMQIEALIPCVESDYLHIRNRDWETDKDGNIVYPVNSEMVAAEMVSYKLLTLGGTVGATWEAVGNYSVSLTADLMYGYPRSIVTKIRRYGRAL